MLSAGGAAGTGGAACRAEQGVRQPEVEVLLLEQREL
jgi:hypothetical protein